MFKRIILASSILMLTGTGFAAASNVVTQASAISIKGSSVDMSQMGPMGQANPPANRLSTEAEMDIINKSPANVMLIAATSPLAQQVQIHSFIEKNGKMIMQQIPSLTIKSHAADDLSYQGIHIMLVGLVQPIHKGQQIPITLIFSDGSHVSVNAVVA